MKINAKAFPFALALAARTSARSFPRFPLLRTNRVSLSVPRPSEHFFLRQTNSRTAVPRRTPSGRSFPIHGVCTIWKGTSWNGVRIGSAPCLAEFRPIRQARLPVRAAGKSCAVAPSTTPNSPLGRPRGFSFPRSRLSLIPTSASVWCWSRNRNENHIARRIAPGSRQQNQSGAVRAAEFFNAKAPRRKDADTNCANLPQIQMR